MPVALLRAPSVIENIGQRLACCLSAAHIRPEKAALLKGGADTRRRAAKLAHGREQYAIPSSRSCSGHQMACRRRRRRVARGARARAHRNVIMSKYKRAAKVSAQAAG